LNCLTFCGSQLLYTSHILARHSEYKKKGNKRRDVITWVRASKLDVVDPVLVSKWPSDLRSRSYGRATGTDVSTSFCVRVSLAFSVWPHEV
jgi:hypothetical protein